MGYFRVWLSVILGYLDFQVGFRVTGGLGLAVPQPILEWS